MFRFRKRKTKPAPQQEAEIKARIYSSDGSMEFDLPRGNYDFVKGSIVRSPSAF